MQQPPTGTPTAAPTAAHIVRVGVDYWIGNSPVYDGTVDWTQLAYANLALGVFVILHSIYLYKFKLGESRSLIDLCAAGAILAAVLVLLNNAADYSDTSMAFYIDFGLNGFSAIMTQIPDDVIFLLGYLYLHKKLSPLVWFLFIFYIILFLYLSYVPIYTIFPFFLNTNSAEFNTYYYYPSGYMYTLGEIVYELFMSGGFIVTLYQVNIVRNRRVERKHQMFALKCCCHCLSR